MKIYFETYGCTSNKADTRIMEGLAKKAGHKVVEEPEDADKVVLNTCVVIDKTENRMLDRIRDFSSEDLVVAGCLCEINREKVEQMVEDVTFISPKEVGRFLELIDDDGNKVSKYEALSEKDGVFGQLQISEGCVGNCSYCITKFARGSLQTFPSKEIVSNALNLIKNGVLELQLTAQDTSTYNLKGKNNLYDLVSSINSIKGDFRVRIGMMNPSNVKRDPKSFLKIFDLEKVYNFFHLPVQSGSNDVLDNMRRGYRVEDFKEIVEEYRKMADGVLSTDIIAGFPGENEEDFQRTVSLLREVKPDLVNITRYSPRPGTNAYEMEDVDSRTKKERSKKLTEVRKEVGREVNEREVGSIKDVLVLKDGKEDTMMGRDWDYRPVVVRDNDISIGERVETRIEDFTFAYLIGDPR